jgi:ubiquinone/menaquinone biosynthesis C-methylase UbiE
MMAEKEDYQQVSRVHRSKDDAEKYYNRISVVYDWLGGIFERKHAEKALSYLEIENGEVVLEIGFGTGHCLQQIALLVGKTGKAYGIDISDGMLRMTRRRLEKAALLDRVELYQGDASKLPFNDCTFDVVFMSFTLELFDTPEIPELISELLRVLKTGGSVGVASLSKIKGNPLALRMYECLHRKFPKYADCRPIYLEESLSKAGFRIRIKETYSLFALPVEIVVAYK